MAKKSRRTKSAADVDANLFDLTDEAIEAGTSAATADSQAVNADGSTRIALHETARHRYLNYALSVITSRALPDVRDGLKPVQRRILYTMWQMRLTATAKHRKCAGVVGAVMQHYHPHGNEAIYDALVRQAQPFVMRVPLVDGSGNFGSVDGDAPAAMRYTECRLAAASDQLLQEIDQNTVAMRTNYDGARDEPVVLPSKLPNLLINGAAGIAVGMATNIPPHNPGELCHALIKLLDNPELQNHHLCKHVKGPDFPTGGQILNSAEELREIYKQGQGSVKLRGTWEQGEASRSGPMIYITSIPYAVNKATLVERIGDVVVSRKMPLITDVRDLSADDVRIAIQLKRDADPAKVMAYLFKHTPLQTNFNVNLTCLIPTENPEVGRPERCSLREILWHFLQFRLEVVTRRLEHELAALRKRIHILEGFATVFDALDEIIRIIRRSDGKADAARKIMKRFPADDQGGGLDAEQTDAILELKLYRLAKLEIQLIREELEDKRQRADQISKLLADEAGRWSIVRDELDAIRKAYAKSHPRLTVLEPTDDEPTFSEEDFIVAEDNQVILTRDGWVKRQKDIRDPSTTRLREGDSVLAAEAGSTRASIVFFSNFGVAYTCRIIDVPPTTGYGEPIQKLFKLKDGETIVACRSLDPRSIGDIEPPDEDHCPLSHAVAVTSDGYSLRFGLELFVEPSTRTGRKFARPAKGSQVVGVQIIHGSETIIAATYQGRAMLCAAEQINYLAGAGKGVMLIKLNKDDRVIGFKASSGDRDLLTVQTSRGSTQTISTAKYEVISRGGKGREILKRGQFTRIVEEEAVTPVMLDDENQDD